MCEKEGGGGKVGGCGVDRIKNGKVGGVRVLIGWLSANSSAVSDHYGVAQPGRLGERNRIRK